MFLRLRFQTSRSDESREHSSERYYSLVLRTDTFNLLVQSECISQFYAFELSCMFFVFSVRAVLKKREYGTKYTQNNFITTVRAMNEFCLKPRYL